jgi:hypothetical protein
MMADYAAALATAAQIIRFIIFPFSLIGINKPSLVELVIVRFDCGLP